MREHSRRAFPDPDVVPQEAPSPIEDAGTQRRLRAAVIEDAVLRRACAERAQLSGAAVARGPVGGKAGISAASRGPA